MALAAGLDFREHDVGRFRAVWRLGVALGALHLLVGRVAELAVAKPAIGDFRVSDGDRAGLVLNLMTISTASSALAKIVVLAKEHILGDRHLVADPIPGFLGNLLGALAGEEPSRGTRPRGVVVADRVGFLASDQVGSQLHEPGEPLAQDAADDFGLAVRKLWVERQRLVGIRFIGFREQCQVEAKLVGVALGTMLLKADRLHVLAASVGLVAIGALHDDHLTVARTAGDALWIEMHAVVQPDLGVVLPLAAARSRNLVNSVGGPRFVARFNGTEHGKLGVVGKLVDRVRETGGGAGGRLQIGVALGAKSIADLDQLLVAAVLAMAVGAMRRQIGRRQAGDLIVVVSRPRMAHAASLIGSGAGLVVERDKPARRLPGFDVAFLAIVGKRSMGLRERTGLVKLAMPSRLGKYQSADCRRQRDQRQPPPPPSQTIRPAVEHDLNALGKRFTRAVDHARWLRWTLPI